MLHYLSYSQCTTALAIYYQLTADYILEGCATWPPPGAPPSPPVCVPGSCPAPEKTYVRQNRQAGWSCMCVCMLCAVIVAVQLGWRSFLQQGKGVQAAAHTCGWVGRWQHPCCRPRPPLPTVRSPVRATRAGLHSFKVFSASLIRSVRPHTEAGEPACDLVHRGGLGAGHPVAAAVVSPCCHALPGCSQCTAGTGATVASCCSACCARRQACPPKRCTSSRAATAPSSPCC